MVGKLLKHELKYYLRILTPVYVILAVIALLGRVVLFFEQDDPVYYLTFGSSVAMFVLACFAALLLTTVFYVVRFYKNMFRGEGYLTMTLPATPAQHLFVKLLAAWLAELATLGWVLLCSCLLLVGPWLVEIVKAAAYIYNKTAQVIGAHLFFYILEYILVIMISMLPAIMTYYFCMCVGQLVRKNRILVSVGVYYGLYVLQQIAGTVFSVAFTIFTASIPPEKMEQFGEVLGQWILKLVENNMIFYVPHVMILVTMIWPLLVAAFYFLVCRVILSRKLNLE